MISAWIRHRMDVIRRRTRYELNKAEARAHILEGFLKALSHGIPRFHQYSGWRGMMTAAMM